MITVLVHGAWMDARCWRQVEEFLPEPRFAINLPGHGLDTTPAGLLSLDLYVETVVSAIAQAPEPVTLVGHGFGGLVISQVGETAPGKVRRLIYLAAYLPRDGESLDSLAAGDQKSLAGPELRPAPDWSTLDITEASRRELFFHDVPDEVAAIRLGEWKPEAGPPLTTPVRLTEANFGSIPRWYIHTDQDRVVSPELQRQMVDNSPVEAQFWLDCGHAAMLARPAELAEILTSAR